MCGKKNSNKNPTPLETHHINQQKDCDDDGFVKDKSHIKKNQIFNLMVICQECHDKIHAGKLNVEGIKMTSSGKKIIIKERKE